MQLDKIKNIILGGKENGKLKCKMLTYTISKRIRANIKGYVY